jgi:hypothetical protein
MVHKIARPAVIAIQAGRLPLLSACWAVILAAALIMTAGSARASVSHFAAPKLPGSTTSAASPRLVMHSESAATLPPAGYGKGSGYCKSYPGGVKSSYSFENIYACDGTTTGATTFDNPGAGVYAWQCVELSARYLWAVDGIWAGPGSGVLDGADLVSVVHASNPDIAVGTPGPGSVPVAGDVISLGPGGGSDPASGHTAVIISSDPSTGQFEVMSENDPDGTAGEQSLQVDLTGSHNGEVLFSGAWTQASWLETSMPDTPGNVAAVAVSQYKIKVTWTEASTDVTGFNIDNGCPVGSCSPGATLAQTTGPVKSATFKVTPGTYQCFRAQAFNDAGASSWSDYGCTSTSGLVVPATQKWTDTKVQVAAGDTLGITANGQITISPTESVGPAGDPSCTPAQNYPRKAFPAPSAPCWSLIARIGNGTPFEVGASALVTTSSGVLYLGINDNNFSGNSGSWTVNIKLGGLPPSP